MRAGWCDPWKKKKGPAELCDVGLLGGNGDPKGGVQVVSRWARWVCYGSKRWAFASGGDGPVPVCCVLCVPTGPWQSVLCA